MGTTQFPKIPSPPVNPDLKSLSQYVSEVSNLIAVLSKELDFLLNGSLDVQNIRAKSITADTLNVDELSAISANMGHITSGRIDSAEIYGSYIATADGTFPRSEMDVSGNLLRIYLDVDNYIELNPVFGGGSPALSATVEGNTAYQLTANTSGVVLSTGAKDLTLSTVVQGDINLFPESGFDVHVPGWDRLVEDSSGEALATALSNKANVFTGVSGTVFVAATSGGATTKAITFSNGIRTS